MRSILHHIVARVDNWQSGSKSLEKRAANYDGTAGSVNVSLAQILLIAACTARGSPVA